MPTSDLLYGEKEISEAGLVCLDKPTLCGTVVRMRCPEFTCKCPRSGFPDFATVYISYIPVGRIVELKSLKLWLNGFRDEGFFHEDLPALIGQKLLAQLGVGKDALRVVMDFNVRGNIKTVVEWGNGPDSELAPNLVRRTVDFSGL